MIFLRCQNERISLMGLANGGMVDISVTPEGILLKPLTSPNDKDEIIAAADETLRRFPHDLRKLHEETEKC